MMKRIVIIGLLLILMFFSLTACWNQQELTDLTFVMALGIDKGTNERYQVSFQFVNPGNVSSSQFGGGQGPPIAVAKATGNTITEAARNVTKKIPRELYYAHTNLVIISEEVAKEKDLFLSIFDSLGRDPEFRRTTELVIAKGSTAEEILSTITILEKLPVNKITKQIKTNEGMLGEDITVNIDDFVSGIVSTGKEPILTGYMLMGKKGIAKDLKNLEKTIPDAFLQADGLAVFSDGKLTGWIDHNNARGVLWVLNKVKSTQINVNWEDKKNALNVVPIRSKTKVSVVFKDGKPVIHINVENEGWISEANIAIELTDPKVISKIEKKVEENIKKEILKTVKVAQKQKSDIFGFGDRVHRANPKLWKKLKWNWNEYFANLEVKVEVDSYIRREGVKTNPFWSNLGK